MDERIGFGLYESCGVVGVCGEWVGAWTWVFMGVVVLCLCEL